MRAIIVALISACATTPPPPAGGPRGLHASDHLDEAHAHDQVAKHRFAGHEDDDVQPWTRHWDTRHDDEQAAAVHRSQAADLQAAYEQACKGRTLAQASASPLERSIGGYATATTVVFYLDRRIRSPDRLLADLACHRAWMMLAPEDDKDDPLDLPGLVIDANGGVDGIAVSISARDPEIVAELLRRSAHLLEHDRPRADVR